MVTKNLINCYCNHLFATTVIYLSIIDPIQEFANNLDNFVNSLQSNAVNKNFNTIRNTRLLSLVSANNDNQQDYYEILGVNKDATKHEIHKAFRQLAKKYHPDKNKDKNAQDEFIKIFKAYETLSNEKKRKEYDDRSNGNYNHFNNNYQQTNGLNDFDINDFFKQYEDQFLKHAQFFQQQHLRNHHEQHNSHHNHHHQQHFQNNANHQHFKFHGVDLDDLFHDIDENEFHSYRTMFNTNGHVHSAWDMEGDSFGDGASFFGSHLSDQIHDTIHRYNSPTGGGFYQQAASSGYSCQTITKQVNGMTMTQTSCM